MHADEHIENRVRVLSGAGVVSRPPRAGRMGPDPGARLRGEHARRRASPDRGRTVRPAPGQGCSSEPTTRQHAFVERLLGRCGLVGAPLRAWAEAALATRGIRAIRLIQGVLGLTRRHPRERVLHAATLALTHQRFRYKDLARRAAAGETPPRPLLTDDPVIRPMADSILELF